MAALSGHEAPDFVRIKPSIVHADGKKTIYHYMIFDFCKTKWDS